MKKQLLRNGMYSLAENSLQIGNQFITSLILVRSLPITEYSLIGIAMGYFVFVNFINVAMEPILFRKFRDFKGKIDRYIFSLVVINVFKAFLLLSAFISFSYLAAVQLNTYHVYWAVGIIITPVLADCLVGPFTVYAAVLFQQKLSTMLIAWRNGLNLILMLGLFVWPTLPYVLFKEVVVNIIYVVVAQYVMRRKLHLSFSDLTVDWTFLKRTFLSYSMWTHSISVVVFFIYRADTFFLSFFVSMESIGYYTVALNCAMIANLMPQILAQQNHVALSRLKNREVMIRMTNMFVRFSIYIGAATLLGFVVLGKPYLWLQVGFGVPEETYRNLLCIVTGLVLAKTCVSPYNAYLSIKGSVSGMFVRVILPTGASTAVLYYFAARFYGTQGIALANIFAALIWLGLQLLEMRRYGYHFKGVFAFKKDWHWIKGQVLTYSRSGVS